MSSLVPRALTELAREYSDLREQIVQREADGAMELFLDDRPLERVALGRFCGVR